VSSNCHVTFPPTFTDTVFGEKARFFASTTADALGATVVVGAEAEELLPPPHAPASTHTSAVAVAVAALRLIDRSCQPCRPVTESGRMLCHGY
jgi:hypothetical protein